MHPNTVGVSGGGTVLPPDLSPPARHSHKIQMPPKAKRWCFTLNNPTAGETDIIAQVLDSQHVTYGIYGKETGESGTPHLQGYVIFDTDKRLTQLRTLLGPRGHYEVSRGTPQEASDYCKKDGDFNEYGILPTGRTRPPKQGKWDLLVQWIGELSDAGDPPPSEPELYRRFPGLMGPQRRGVLALVASLYRPNSREIGHPRDGWQSDLASELSEEPDERTIQFVIDPIGHAGKTWFSKYIFEKYPDKTQVLRIGKKADLAHSIDPRRTIFLFDIPRRGLEFLQYSVLEEIKDGLVYSPKYDSCTKRLKTSHVVVFTNEEPDMNALTYDRYKITRISENTFIP